MVIIRERRSLLLVPTVALMCGLVAAVVPEVYKLCDNSRSNIVEVTPSRPQFNTQSPNFGNGNYSDNANCTLVLKSGSQPLVVLYFYRQFNVEYESKCGYDSLCVHGVKYCGIWETGFAFLDILPENNRLTIRFTTDRSITRPGFEITVIPQKVALFQTVMEARGNGSSDDGVRYVPVKYYPGMIYRDGC